MAECNDMNQSELESDISAEVTPTLAIDSVGRNKRVSGPTRRSTKGGWTTEEDKLLTNAVRKYNGKNWKKIAECVRGCKDEKNNVQCQHRWLKVLNPNLNKGPWKQEEDDLLSELVKDNMKNDKPQWSKISKLLPGRIGKQCRERWHNHLNPTIKKTPWTKEEELVLVQVQKEHGNKWAEIAKLLPGRTENNIKNHWNCSLKKRLEQFPSNLFSDAVTDVYGSRPSGFESNFVNQSNLMHESYITFPVKEAAKSLQSDQLDLSLGLMNWRSTPSSTSPLRNEESISLSVESDCSRLNESVETPQSSKGNVCVQEVKEIKEKLRMAASTYKNTPSIISKRSSPASDLKRQRQKDGTPFQTDARSHLSSEEERSVSTLSLKRNTCSAPKPLERRLNFDFM